MQSSSLSSGNFPAPENNQTIGNPAISPFYMPPDEKPEPDQSDPSYINDKIEYWGKFSIKLGLIAFLGSIFTICFLNVTAHGTQRHGSQGWGIVIMAYAWLFVMFILFILSLISLIRIIILSKQRGKHDFEDYVKAVIGSVLIFSPIPITFIAFDMGYL